MSKQATTKQVISHPIAQVKVRRIVPRVPNNLHPVHLLQSPLTFSSFGVSQGSNDVLKVLCSGEPTAGKFLMHILLFYGNDSMTMAIDVTAPDNGKGPFVPRQAGGAIDPFTGMLTVEC